jgi:hypothetical protein
MKIILTIIAALLLAALIYSIKEMWQGRDE